MKLTDSTRRPGFASDTVKVDDKSIKKLIPPIKTKTADRSLRVTSFSEDEPKKRRFPDFERIKQLNIQKEGIKVQLGPNTLKQFLSVKVPDKNNPNILIEKNVSLGELLQTTNGRLEAMNALIERLRAQENRNSLRARTAINQLATTVVAELTNFQTMSRENYRKVLESLQFLDIPNNPKDAGLPDFLLNRTNLNRDNLGIFLAFLLHKRNINDPNLDQNRPVYGVGGRPITIRSMVEGIMNRNETIDVIGRQMYVPGDPRIHDKFGRYEPGSAELYRRSHERSVGRRRTDTDRIADFLSQHSGYEFSQPEQEPDIHEFFFSADRAGFQPYGRRSRFYDDIKIPSQSFSTDISQQPLQSLAIEPPQYRPRRRPIVSNISPQSITLPPYTSPDIATLPLSALDDLSRNRPRVFEEPRYFEPFPERSPSPPEPEAYAFEAPMDIETEYKKKRGRPPKYSYEEQRRKAQELEKKKLQRRINKPR